MIYFEDKIGWRLLSLVAVQLYAFPALIKIPMIHIFSRTLFQKSDTLVDLYCSFSIRFHMIQTAFL